MVVVDALAVAACCAAAITDLIEQRILNVLTGPLIVLGVIFYLVVPAGAEGLPAEWLGGRLFGLWGVLAAGVPFFLLYAVGVVGAGDAKLMMGLGALLGPVAAVRVGVVTIVLFGVFLPVWFVATGRLASLGLSLRHGVKRATGRSGGAAAPAPSKLPMGLTIALAVLLEVGATGMGLLAASGAGGG